MCNTLPAEEVNQHLMTGLKGNSELYFPETLNVPRGREAKRKMGDEGNQNSPFPVEPVFCYTSQPKIGKNAKNMIRSMPLHVVAGPALRVAVESEASCRIKTAR